MGDYFTQTNPLVKQYRAYLEQGGEADPRPDTELTIELGNALRDEGNFDAQAELYPEFRQQYLTATQATSRSIPGELTAGISRGARGLAGTAMEAAALGLDVIGADDWAKSVSESAKKVAASGNVRPTIREMGDIQSFGGAVRYGLGKIGEAAPSLAESAGMALLGGAVTGGPGAIAGLVGKESIKSMLKSGVAKRLLGKEVAEEVTEASVKAALKTGANTELRKAFGAAALSTANSYGLAAGEIYGDTGDVSTAAIAGLISAIPDTVLPTYVATKFFGGPVAKEIAEKAGGFWDRFFKEAIKTVPVEMGTEGFQEAVNIAAKKYHEGKDWTLTREDIKQIKEAAIGGAAGGAIAAPIAAAPRPMTAEQREEQLKARRKAATTPAIETPPPPAATTPTETAPPPKKVPALMTDEEQDARFAALEQFKANGTIGKDESGELEVLRALIGQRKGASTSAPAAGAGPSATAPTAEEIPPPAGAPASTQTPAAAAPDAAPMTEEQFVKEVNAVIQKLPVPAVVKDVQREVPAGGAPPVVVPPAASVPNLLGQTGATGVSAAPPVTPVTPVTPAPAPAPGRMGPTIKKLGSEIVRLKKSVPALDFSGASVALQEFQKNPTPENLARLTSIVEELEVKEGPELARMAEVELTAADARAKKAEADKLAKEVKAAEKAAKKAPAPAASEAAAAPVVLPEASAAPPPAPTPTTPVTPVTPAPGTPPPAGVAPAPALVDEAMKEKLKEKLPPLGEPTPTPTPEPTPQVKVTPLTAGTIKSERFMDIKARVDEVEAEALAAKSATARTKIRLNGYLKIATDLLEKTTSDSEGIFYDKVGNESRTRAGIALELPDGRVIQAGLLAPEKKKGMLRTGPKGGKEVGPSVQGMGTLSGKTNKTKMIAPGGQVPVLLSELVAWGAKPFDLVSFAIKPGTIFQEFASRADYNASMQEATRLAGQSLREKQVSDKTAEEVAEVVGAADTDQRPPAQQIADYLSSDAPAIKLLRAALDKGMKATSNPILVFDKLTAKQKDLIKTMVGELKLRYEDVVAYLYDRFAPPEVAKPKTTPAPAERTSAVEGSAGPVTAVHKLNKDPLPVKGIQKKAAQVKPQAEKKPKAKSELGMATERLEELTAQLTDLETRLKAATTKEERTDLRAEMVTLSNEYRNVANFVANAKKREVDPQKRQGHIILRREQLGALINRLLANGYDIKVIENELGLNSNVTTVGDISTITLSIADLANGNLRNVVDLIHEVGHIEVDRISPGMRAQLSRAVDKAIAAVRAGRLIDPATNANLNWEEKIVEQLAIKLGEEGFGAQAATLAQAIIRTVKDIYYRVGMAMTRALGAEPDPERVIAWFENNMRRRLGGDYDFAFIDLFSHLIESAGDYAARFIPINGIDIPDLVDPIDGLTRAEVLPDTVRAVEWNLNRFRREEPDLSGVIEKRDAQGRLLAPNGKPSKLSERQWKFVRTPDFKKRFGDWETTPVAGLDENGEPSATIRYANRDEGIGGDEMEYTEAMARIQAAGWAEILPLFEQFKNEFGKNMDWKKFWKTYGGRGDMPSVIIDGLETRVPGSTSARIDGEKMTDDMNHRARYHAFRLVNNMSWLQRKRARAEQDSIGKTADNMVKQAEHLNRFSKDLRDSEAMNSVFNEQLVDSIKEIADALANGPVVASRMGELHAAILQGEGLAKDADIPKQYKAVFKSLLDSGGTSVFDQMNAIAKLQLPIGSMKIPDIVKAIEGNAPKDPHLASLAKNRPLMVALSSLARTHSRQLDILNLRLSTNAAEYIATKKDLDEIKSLSLETLEERIEAYAEGRSARDRIAKQYAEARRDLLRSQRTIRQAQERSEARLKMADAMAVKATELSTKIGAYSYWEPHDKATYWAMQPDGKGGWNAVKRELRMVGTEISAQHEQVTHDISQNRLYLETNKEKLKGSRLFEEVKRMSNELSKLDLVHNYQAAHIWGLGKILAPLGQKFGSLGQVTGTRIQQQILAWQDVIFRHSEDIDVAARKWNHALQKASDAANFTNAKHFFELVVNDVIYVIENRPGLEKEAALRVARNAALKRIPSNITVTENFNEKFDALMLAHKEISELFDGIAEAEGLYKNDPRVIDPLTGKGSLLRHSIKYGFFTAPRRLNADIIGILVNTMVKAGWKQGMFEDLKPEGVQAAIDKYFTTEITQKFVDPFVRKPGAEIFFGAKDDNGRAVKVSQLEAQAAWEEAGGDVGRFIEVLFDATNSKKNEDGSVNRDGLGEYQVAMLKNFQDFFVMENSLAEKTQKKPSPLNPFGQKTHRLMDGRVNDMIPPEHYTYEFFSPTNAKEYLAELAFHIAFGRDGVGLERTLQDLDTALNVDAQKYRSIPSGTEKDRKKYAKEQGWDYKKIKGTAEDQKSMQDWQTKLVTHFTGHQAVTKSWRAALDLAQLNMTLVLNQPKSALMNLISAMEFPLIYRGLGGTAVKASATVAKEFARGVVGSIFTNFLNESKRTVEHGRDIVEVVEKRKLGQLPFSVLLSDAGADGKLLEGGVANRITQFTNLVQTGLRKTIGKGGFNFFWAPFSYISQKLDSAIAIANVQALESIVQRAAEFYRNNPEHNNPSYRLTAKDLKMDQGGWFSDEGAFEYFRARLREYRLGTLEDMTRESMVRRAKGGPLLTRNQGLTTAMMALNEISLQANTNTRPDWLTDNPVTRMGGLMLGWPLSRVNSVNRAFGDAEGKVTLASAMRASAVIAAWTVPMGLAFSLMMDEYDDEILNKKSNYRPLDPVTLTPVIGPLIGVFNKKDQLYAMLERLARTGTYGMAGDFINSMVNITDPTTGQRDFDLNSRILVFSQFANFRDTLRNFIHQDYEYTYQSVGRPLLTAIGGNGVLQAAQIVNNGLRRAGVDIDNDEYAQTNRISIFSYLRSAGRDAGLSLRSGARSSPTKSSVWYNQMVTSALADDRVGFGEAYRRAVEIEREKGEDDPEQAVLQAFKQRDPMSSVFTHKPTEVEVSKLYEGLSSKGQRVVSESQRRFEDYLDLIAPDPIVRRMELKIREQMRQAQPMTIEQLRRRVAAGAMAY